MFFTYYRNFLKSFFLFFLSQYKPWRQIEIYLFHIFNFLFQNIEYFINFYVAIYRYSLNFWNHKKLAIFTQLRIITFKIKLLETIQTFSHPYYFTSKLIKKQYIILNKTIPLLEKPNLP